MKSSFSTLCNSRRYKAAAGCSTGKILSSPKDRILPRACIILSPGKNRLKACLPSVTMILGETTAICDSKYCEQALNSSGNGSLLSGGLHLTMLVIKISVLDREISARSESRSLPAAPTKGTPCWSSLYPGASPMKNKSEVDAPCPGTAFPREPPREQFWHVSMATARTWRDFEEGCVIEEALGYGSIFAISVRSIFHRYNSMYWKQGQFASDSLPRTLKRSLLDIACLQVSTRDGIALTYKFIPTLCYDQLRSFN